MSAPIGGQAVLEGVMMRGPSHWSLAVRTNGGDIAQLNREINAYEAGDELRPERVQRYSLIHPRCGTAFLLWVMVIAIFVFAFFGQPAWYWLILSRIAMLPVIAGIAYELIRFAGKHTDNKALMTLLAPGLWLQRLTTREPSLDQLEVSIRALKDVLAKEGRLDPQERKVEVMA